MLEEEHVGAQVGAASGLASPRRFFLTAPIAAGGVGAGIAATGVAALQTGWDPLTLSLAHLCTLGFLSMAMFGGLIELATAVGRPAPGRRLAGVFHALLVASIAALCWGTARGRADLVFVAIGALFPVLLLFIVPVAMALRRAPRREHVGAAGFALGAFFAAAVLGIWMAHGHGGMRFPGPRPLWLQVHLCVALLGWIGGLVTGVSWPLLAGEAAAAPGPAAATPPRGARLVAVLLGIGVVAPLAGLTLHWSGAWPAGFGDPVFATALAALPAVVAVWALHPGLVLSGARRRGVSGQGQRLWLAGVAMGPVVLVAAIAAALLPDPRYGLVFGWLALWGWAGLVVHALALRWGVVAAGAAEGRDGVGAALRRQERHGLALHGASLVLGIAAIASGWPALGVATGLGVVATAIAMGRSVACPIGRRPSHASG